MDKSQFPLQSSIRCITIYFVHYFFDLIRNINCKIFAPCVLYFFSLVCVALSVFSDNLGLPIPNINRFSLSCTTFSLTLIMSSISAESKECITSGTHRSVGLNDPKKFYTSETKKHCLIFFFNTVFNIKLAIIYTSRIISINEYK